jgi:aspartate--ammonia ligase
MSTVYVPANYKSALSVYETQQAIGSVKRIFEDALSEALGLIRVTAPLFVDPTTGLNDDLNGVERPVEFGIAETRANAQIVQSLAKWKRMALYQYGFPSGKGLYTDMNAVRRDEALDNLHSVYVDQWDWEVVITREDRNEAFLMETVKTIVNAIADTAETVKKLYPALTAGISRSVAFVTTQELEDLYPALPPKERENEFVREHKTAFVMQVGRVLKSGVRHDGRAPDYDDWTLNGDIVFWNELLGRAFEVSSMGIRVDAEACERQLAEAGCGERRTRLFHRLLLDGTLPLSMGGGIGQSRLCMLLLQKAHIGEVQVSVWDDKTLAECAAAGLSVLELFEARGRLWLYFVKHSVLFLS